MEEADIDRDGKISKVFFLNKKLDENDFMYIISKQKLEHKQKLTKEASIRIYLCKRILLLLWVEILI